MRIPSPTLSFSFYAVNFNNESTLTKIFSGKKTDKVRFFHVDLEVLSLEGESWARLNRMFSCVYSGEEYPSLRASIISMYILVLGLRRSEILQNATRTTRIYGMLSKWDSDLPRERGTD